MSVKIMGKELPEIPMVYSLKRVFFGIGLTLSKEILDLLNIDWTIRPSKLNDQEINSLNVHLRDNLKIDSRLRNELSLKCLALVKKGCYRGLRHIAKLPVRGQNTSSNARTNKKLGRRYVI